MTNTVAIILTIALLADTAANIARLWGVRITIHQQEDMMRREIIEGEKRINAAAEIFGEVVKETIDDLAAKTKEFRGDCDAASVACERCEHPWPPVAVPCDGFPATDIELGATCWAKQGKKAQ
jgi:hypothetical protein